MTSIHTPDLPAGVEWAMTYDGDARLASVTDPQGFTESYGYEPTGERKSIVDKLARQTTWSHDQLGRVLAMVDTAGRRHANTYSVPVSGAWSGPTLMAGGADAATPSTSRGDRPQTRRGYGHRRGEPVPSSDAVCPSKARWPGPPVALSGT